MNMDAGSHEPACAIHECRRQILTDLAKAPADPYLLGALVEYYGYGDQEAEICDCGWYPKPRTHTLALAILGMGDDKDFTDVYEACQPFMSREDFVSLGASLEACPIHYCDVAICIDDGVHGMEVYG